MMRWVVYIVIGGRSGKREAAVLILLLWIALVAIAASTGSIFLQDLSKTVIYPVLAALAGAFGLEHLKPQPEEPVIDPEVFSEGIPQ